MASPAATPSDTFPLITGYTLTERLYEGSRTAVYRAVSAAQQAVVIKVLRQPYPLLRELVHFRNQYTIGQQLDHPGLVRMEGLVACGNGQALVMEDVGGLSLAKYVKQKAQEKQSLSVIEVLSIGVQLADILHYLGQQRVIHKDIKPANILIHPQSKQVKLIDFSIASLLPRETQEIKNPHGLEGTLAYLSPEQTGRMNRGIDYRSDFYALGVTLFELLTGVLPFQSDDPLAWIHCHIAKQAPIANDLAPIPAVVGTLVHKLMAKNAEDRYQSALGLKHDLETCLYQMKDTGSIETFEIGQQDRCDRFLIPEKLYGRTHEVNTLLAAFDRVNQGTTELMLVAGFSGMGKTAVIKEVHKPIVKQRGYFVTGKYDQFQRNIPLLAFIQAFRDLIRQLLSETDEQLATWKIKILAALGDNAQVMVEVIPELGQIIGPQPEVSPLSGNAAQNRFTLMLQKFVQVFSTAHHPLVLFLDDLQWADAASLSLLQSLMQDSSHLLVLGAYRDNEVSPSHPFILTIKEIKSQGVTVNQTVLNPLAVANINQLVADTLNCELPVALPLTKLVHQKTKGNPFFVTQFLTSLHQAGWISFVPETGHWQCDINQIRTLSLTEDVVELMAIQLQKLPPETQTQLKLAACIGAQFDLKTLAIVSEKSEIEVASGLWKALQSGFILPTDETYKFYQPNEAVAEANTTTKTLSGVGSPRMSSRYRFLHDRVQQAAYSLIPASQKQTVHSNIAQLLLTKLTETEQAEQIFEIASHLNRGVKNSAHQKQLIQINLQAGRKAKQSTAYPAAFEFFEQVRQHLPEKAWESHYTLMRDLHHELVEISYLIGDFEQLETFAEQMHSHAQDLFDQIPIYELQVQSLSANNQHDAAIDLAIDVLKKLGLSLPSQPKQAHIVMALLRNKLTLVGKAPLDLLALPTMSDRTALAMLRILSKLMGITLLSRPALLPIVVFKQVGLSVKHGNMPLSAIAYTWYGMILSAVVGDIATGYQFGELGIQLADKFNDQSVIAESGVMFAGMVKHWQKPLRASIEPMRLSYQLALESGNNEYACRAALVYPWCRLLTGSPLVEVEADMRAYNQAIAQMKQANSSLYGTMWHQSVCNLLGQSQTPYVLIGEVFNEQTALAEMQQTNERSGMSFMMFLKLMLCCIFDQPAVDIVAAGDKVLDSTPAFVSTVPFYFYASLALLAAYPHASEKEQSQLMKRVNQKQKKLKKWAASSPSNYQHRYNLIEAERYGLLGQHTQAIEHFQLAISGAQVNGYPQDQALAHERTAKYYLQKKEQRSEQETELTTAQSPAETATFAESFATHMKKAYYGYAQWGAKAKTDELETRYPDILQPIAQQQSQVLDALDTKASLAASSTTLHATNATTRSSSTTINASLDLTAVLQAFQVLSSTIEIESLLQQLTQIILQNSGADRCVFIRPNQQEQWCVEANATSTTFSLSSEPIETSSEIPLKLIQYVKNTQSVVMIDDLKTDLPVIGDTLQQQQPKSLLCLPILNQSHLLGVLYLRNKSTSGVFTEERITVLNLLCTQAAISLENARLYQQAQDYANQLEESQLQTVQSEKMASLGNLVAGVAHEINNPIGFLNGSIRNAETFVEDIVSQLALYQKHYPHPADEIQENADDLDLDFVCTDLPKLLRSMQGATDRIKSISTSLRTFSRADTEHKVSGNLHEGLDSTLLILKYRLKANEQRPAIDVIKDYGDLPVIDCFPGRLNQVFMNLLANAIDVFDEVAQQSTFAELKENPQRISIATTVLAGKKSIEIRIRDNGKGMPEAVKARIFDHLFTTKGVGKGTGLGLAIVQQIIVDAHSGTIEVQSEPGQGTEFCIQLPL